MNKLHLKLFSSVLAILIAWGSLNAGSPGGAPCEQFELQSLLDQEKGVFACHEDKQQLPSPEEQEDEEGKEGKREKEEKSEKEEKQEKEGEGKGRKELDGDSYKHACCAGLFQEHSGLAQKAYEQSLSSVCSLLKHSHKAVPIFIWGSAFLN